MMIGATGVRASDQKQMAVIDDMQLGIGYAPGEHTRMSPAE